MKLSIFGGSGRTGRHLISFALTKSHHVTTLSRSMDKTNKVKVVRGDILNQKDVERTIKGSDAVIYAIGVKNSPRDVVSRGIINVITAMQKFKVKRLVIESAYGVFETKKGFYGNMLWVMAKDKMKDKEIMENLVRQTDLDYTVIRPVWLTEGRPTGKVRHRARGVWPSVSRADVAGFMISQLENKENNRKSVTVS